MADRAHDVLIGLVHLNGPRRGRSETHAAPFLRVGSDADADVRIQAPGVQGVHAYIEVDRGEAHLRAVAPVFLNRHPVDEVVLEDGDLLELGEGLRLRVRISRAEDGAAAGCPTCGVAIPPPRRRARRRWGAALFASCVLAAGGASYVAWRMRPQEDSRLRASIAEARLDLARRDELYAASVAGLREELSALERRTADLDVDEEVRGEIQRALAEFGSDVYARLQVELGNHPDLRQAREALKLVSRVSAPEQVIERYSPSVCLIQGAYGFAREEADGRWVFLREVEDDLLGEVDHDSDKMPLTLGGAGRIFQVEYTGTGFLAHESGVVVTNRHIVEPWWRNDAAKPLIADGFEPRFLFLRAYFPGRAEPVHFDSGRTLVSDEADVAVLGFSPGGELPEALPLDGATARGRRIVLLGYPSGIHALLAKSDEDLSAKLLDDEDFDPAVVLDRLAESGMVRPLPSQGYVGDILDDKILYDAPTALGGSGGPVLDLEGRVVAVNYGILKAFRGANFGVPVRYARDLVDRAVR